MKRKRGILKSMFLSFLLIIFAFVSHAQDRTITGTVTDESGEAIPGASIVVSGTATGTITGADGSYSLTVPANATHLIFSFVGLTTQQIEIGDMSVIDASMAEDAIGLDEVVVIGYGTARKADLTGAIVNVQAEEFVKYQPSNVTDMLRTAIPGLKVDYSTNAKNTPDFKIRGDITIKAEDDDDDDPNQNGRDDWPERQANKPLIVLDGVIYPGDMAAINVNDIESIDVLKDASAASIYGSRASNGVIVITTKKGVAGKPVIRVSAKTGLVTGARRLETWKGGDEVMNWLTDMNESINTNPDGSPISMNEWTRYDKYENIPASAQSDWLTANGIPGETNPTTIANAWLSNFGFDQTETENYHSGTIYDWQDFLFQTGIRQDYDLSIAGGSDKSSYYWSAGYLDNESVQMFESFTTITSRLNLDAAPTDWLNVGINANFSYFDEGPESIDGTGGYRTGSPYDWPWENGTEGIVIGEENADKREFLKTASSGSNRTNPYLDRAYVTRQWDRYNLFSTMYARVKLPFGIKLTSNFSHGFSFRNRLEYNDGAHPKEGHGGEIERHHRKGVSWQLDNILNWDKEFGNHRFALTGLVNAEREQIWNTESETSNLSPTEALGYHATSFGLVPTADSNDEARTRSALMGRINYAYGNRYNLSASVRRDGYSRFGADNVYAIFPSVSAAWTISGENFMANAPGWLSFLKLRASWGVNGNSSGLGAYQSYARLGDNKYLHWDGGYYAVPRLWINRMANPTLSWEKNQAINVAIDYGLWGGRVRGSLDVYTSETQDLLLDKKLPIVTGFEDITTNVGSLRNTGFDLSINTVNVQTADLTFTSSLNINYNVNEIVSLTGELVPDRDGDGNVILDSNGDPVMIEPDDTDNGWYIGQSKDVIADYEIDGVYQIGQEEEAAVHGLYPGDFRIKDQNGDGVINSKDIAFLGVTEAPWYMTFRNEVTYKGFDLGVVLLAKLGYKGGSDNPFNEDQTYIKNHNWYQLPYWMPDNPINNAARINSIMLTQLAYYENRSYMRVQSISLGYNLPSSLLSKMKFSRARVAFNIDNAAVLTKWIEGDPESMREMPRTYTISLDFSF